ncbi:type I-E CRISPR-associated protein Cas7/Cse4/CasC [Streptococcus mutans]|uniref:type I-E CRISPR-associated protein Cas7/Cse4/CasC n=1 Tax=Streptococcus mutans TaxID=1309 RepID=UPI0002B51601|nr:type I-E CRISPR-associated protein Cas7/Cse4/CasC [Streptococcus mutans]EMB96756.1 hypothetical protein SMU61_01457 [Streptococcus mutans G123]EMC04673.1 hypothetical protein SMU69_07235 [Streptococcus mutans NLML4]MCB4971531.1 type I-E CRISPR-associated protein Cas7/Cse4/CasC [Streptococcus mutans]MCB4972510.1 type I-E CRISPR-associated protein Cas7/Cse4/CasC [Streptococcus mutans]MCB5080840.1 type I-E CRISPR-associated protein Cas7/Cse4/CasC [Streptococcus mutans]
MTISNNQDRLFLDIYAIQTLPPSNINRDDTGSPKTTQYGGVRRARVSSQSWKKAMRDYFYEHAEEEQLGKRTRKVVNYVAEKIIHQKIDLNEKESSKLATDILKLAGVPTDGKVLFFIGNTEAEKLATAAVKGVKDKEEARKIMQSNLALDVALFGRMVANDKEIEADASSQFAHPISTHAVQTEFDFYTAVDDLASDDDAKAGMLGTVEFNSSTLYRYANVAIHEFLVQRGNREDLVDSLQLFIKAFAESMPRGKINSFANQTIPQTLIITVRSDRPVNLVSAFEEPVKSSNGYVTKSIEKLSKEFVKVEKMVKKPVLSFYVSLEEVEALTKVGIEKNSITELVEDFSQELSELIQNR